MLAFYIGMKQKETLRPHRLPRWTIIGDVLLWPIMWLSAGCRATSFRTGDIQNTHPWHCRRVDPGLLDIDQLLRIDKPHAKSIRRIKPFFHLPLLGGWREYVVVKSDAPRYYIGWAIPARDGSQYRIAQLNQLPLMTPVKMLRAGDAPWVDLFAVDDQGRQLPLTLMDEGQLGDNRHPHLSLF